MKRAVLWLVPVLAGLVWAESGANRQAPTYTTTGVVNAASNQANSYAPNTFVSIYGTNLAYTTRGLASSDISGNTLPTILSGTGVRVWVANCPTHIYYVSPTQINVLLPSDLRPGPTQLRVQVDATYGPPIAITITAAAPAFFQLDPHTPIAAHADGSIVTSSSPAAPGEWIVLYATGLGTVIPQPAYGEIPTAAAPLADMANFSITLNGTRIPASKIAYAGVAPGFGGLYQINLQLPNETADDPEIRMSTVSATSASGVRLPVHRR